MGVKRRKLRGIETWSIRNAFLWIRFLQRKKQWLTVQDDLDVQFYSVQLNKENSENSTGILDEFRKINPVKWKIKAFDFTKKEKSRLFSLNSACII